MPDYDLVVIGGSIAGLITAREVSKHGFSVLVIEEDLEIGSPEHCGGVVSLKALLELGVIPNNIILSDIKSTKIYSPTNKVIEIPTKNVVAIDRRKLDKYIGKQAIRNNTKISLNTSMLSYEEKDDHLSIKTDKGIVNTKLLVDARGCKVMLLEDKNGAIPSAQYEICGDWIDNSIEVYLDNQNYPAFFAWLIPNGNYLARVGVGGKGINISKRMESFLKNKVSSPLKYIYAPIWINGPLKKFVYNRVIRVGDSAGQTKPTTGGGIYSCGIAGIFAGDAISNALRENDLKLLHNYEYNWFGKFGREFEKMLLVRQIFERLDNKTIENIFNSIDDNIIKEISKTDFDFHSYAIIKLLGVSKSLNLIKNILGNEIRKLFN